MICNSVFVFLCVLYLAKLNHYFHGYGASKLFHSEQEAYMLYMNDKNGISISIIIILMPQGSFWLRLETRYFMQNIPLIAVGNVGGKGNDNYT